MKRLLNVSKMAEKALSSCNSADKAGILQVLLDAELVIAKYGGINEKTNTVDKGVKSTANEVSPLSSRQIIREFNDILLAGHGDLPVLCNGKPAVMVDTYLSNTINISFLSPLSPAPALTFKSVYSDVISNFDGHLIRANGGDIYYITVKDGAVGIHSA